MHEAKTTPRYPGLKYLEYVEKNYQYIEVFGVGIIVNSNWVHLGSVSNGDPRKDGYSRICVNVKGQKKFIKFHHIVWFLNTGRWPRKSIDHINRRRWDNKFQNLRELSHAENMRNKTKKYHKRNKL